jgi:hypothetical protein
MLPAVPRGPRDPETQRRFYAALAEILEGELENRDSLGGFFLWNWPIDPERGGETDDGFSLRGKGLDDLLRRLVAR